MVVSQVVHVKVPFQPVEVLFYAGRSAGKALLGVGQHVPLPSAAAYGKLQPCSPSEALGGSGGVTTSAVESLTGTVGQYCNVTVLYCNITLYIGHSTSWQLPIACTMPVHQAGAC